MSDTPKPPYHIDNTDCYELYDNLVGPDGFECCLTEPEDRTWSRDLRIAQDRLNEQHAELAALRQTVKQQAAEIERLRSLLRLAKTMTGHDHWDSTMRHGAGCPKCIKQVAVCKAINVELEGGAK